MNENNLAPRCAVIVHDGYLSDREKERITRLVESRFKAKGYGTEKKPIPIADFISAMEKQAAKRLNKNLTRKAR